MKATGFKIIPILVFLSLIFNIILPFGFSVSNNSFFNNTVPGVFGVVLSVCMPIDVIGNAVNKILNNNDNADSVPLKNNTHDNEKSSDVSSLFLPPQSIASKYSKDLKDSYNGAGYLKTANYTVNISVEKTKSGDGRQIVLLFMILLAYISILYRDVWVNKFKENIY